MSNAAHVGGAIEVVRGEAMGMRSLLRAAIEPEPGSAIRVSGRRG